MREYHNDKYLKWCESKGYDPNNIISAAVHMMCCKSTAARDLDYSDCYKGKTKYRTPVSPGVGVEFSG